MCKYIIRNCTSRKFYLDFDSDHLAKGNGMGDGSHIRSRGASDGAGYAQARGLASGDQPS